MKCLGSTSHFAIRRDRRRDCVSPRAVWCARARAPGLRHVKHRKLAITPSRARITVQPLFGHPAPGSAASRGRIIVAAVLHLALAAAAGAQRTSPILGLRVGERIRIDAPGEVQHHFVGTLLFPPSDSLLLASPNGPPVTVHPARITSLEVSRGRSGVRGAVRGLIIGVPVGLLLGFIVGNEPEQTCLDCPVKQRNTREIAAGTVAGAVTGAFIGGFVGRERWISVPLPGRAR